MEFDEPSWGMTTIRDRMGHFVLNGNTSRKGLPSTLGRSQFTESFVISKIEVTSALLFHKTRTPCQWFDEERFHRVCNVATALRVLPENATGVFKDSSPGLPRFAGYTVKRISKPDFCETCVSFLWKLVTDLLSAEKRFVCRWAIRDFELELLFFHRD
jgi:hypothetical protein